MMWDYGTREKELAKWKQYYSDLTALVREIFGDDQRDWPGEIIEIIEEVRGIIREKSPARGGVVSAIVVSD